MRLRSTLACLTIPLLGCGAPSPIVIGYASAMETRTPITDFIQAVLDSTRGKDHVLLWRPPDSSLPADSTPLGGYVKVWIGMVKYPEIVAIVGPTDSRSALTAAPLFTEAKIPHVVPSVTNRHLWGLGPYTFPLAVPDSLEGDFIGRYLDEKFRARSAAVFYVADEYGIGVRQGVLTSLAARGIALTAQVAIELDGGCPPFAESNRYAMVVAAALRQRRPDAVVVAGRSSEVGCVAALIGNALPGVPVIGADGAMPGDRIERSSAGSLASIHLVAFWHPDLPDANSRRFVAAFRAATGLEPDHGQALVYDAVMLVATAIDSVGPHRAAIRDYLASLGGRRKPYHGVTGPIEFGVGSRPNLVMTVHRDGRWVLAE